MHMLVCQWNGSELLQATKEGAPKVANRFLGDHKLLFMASHTLFYFLQTFYSLEHKSVMKAYTIAYYNVLPKTI